jgi:beta-1,4-mannosyltransferase
MKILLKLKTQARNQINANRCQDKMKKAFIFPFPCKDEREHGERYNPYIFHVVESLHDKYLFVNKHKKKPMFGILSLLIASFFIDIVFLSWVENVPDKRCGLFQTFIFLLCFQVFKLRGVRVVWTMHNKISHDSHRLFLKKLLFRFLIIHSDLIVTHSMEGVEYGKNILHYRAPHIVYFPHPPNMQLTYKIKPVKYDIIIWGTIQQYKGIDQFLKYLYLKGIQEKYRIIIVGKIIEEQYKIEISQYLNKMICLFDEFIEPERLQDLLNSSKIVLFTYNSDSVLSSGVLTDTANSRATILGPNKGSFRDLAEQKLIHTYSNFDEMCGKLDMILKGMLSIDSIAFEQYIKWATWENFANFLFKAIEKI